MSNEAGNRPAALIDRKLGILAPESMAGMNKDEDFGRVEERLERRIYLPATARP